MVGTTRSYDANRGWLTGVASTYQGSPATPLIGQSIVRDAAGRVTARSDTVTGVSETFGYDTLNRLASVSTTSPSLSSPITKSFSYDAVGDILTKSDVGTYHYAGSQPYAVSSITPNSGPTLSFAYDADGSMTSGGGRTIAYNAEEMTSSVTEGANTVSYTYDSGNQRALQTTPTETTHYYGFADNGHSELQVYPAGGGSRWIDYIHTPTGMAGAIYTTIPASGATTTTTQYFAADHLGSVAATVVANGSNPVERSYDAWGKQRFTSGQDDTGNTLMASNATTDAEPRGFIGQEQVAAINLVDLNRRLYDPWVGRFLSADPVIASVGDAQALNPYAYAGNNPLTDSDPSGACGFFCSLGRIFSFDGFLERALPQSLQAVLRPVIAIGAAVLAQYYILPEVEGFDTFAAVAEASPALAAADVAVAGAVGGAINTGTLRGSLIGAATAEAFWGVGQVGNQALGIPPSASFSALSPGQIAGAVALHAAVGCVSSAAGGGRCGSGALAASLGELTSGYAPDVTGNPLVQGAVAGLGGGAGSALTGGRFGDGFFIAASGYIFNEMADAWAGNQAARALANKLNAAGGNWTPEVPVWYDLSSWGRADLVDNNTNEVYELKTWNTLSSQSGINAASKQVGRYAEANGYTVGQDLAQFDGQTAVGLVMSVSTMFYYGGGPAPGLVGYVNASVSQSWYYQVYKGTKLQNNGGGLPLLAPEGVIVLP